MRNAALLFALALLSCSPAGDAEQAAQAPEPAAPTVLRVLTGGAVQEILRELAAEFAAENGVELMVENATAGQIRQRVEGGEMPDIVVISEAVITVLAQGGHVAPEITPVGRVGVGVAIRTGETAPAIATVEEFRDALLSVDRVAYMDPAGGSTSGAHFAGVLQQMGIADEVNADAVLVAGGYSAERVANGEADIAVQQVSELLAVPGVQVIGMLPDELQAYTTYSAAIGAHAVQPELAAEFIAFLTRAEWRPRWEPSGVLPPN